MRSSHGNLSLGLWHEEKDRYDNSVGELGKIEGVNCVRIERQSLGGENEKEGFEFQVAQSKDRLAS